MRKGLKVALAAFVVVALVVVVGFLGLLYFSRNAVDMQGEAWRDGRHWGERGLDKRACEREALARGDKCGVNPACRLRAAAFAEGCMSQAPLDDPLCDGVPRIADVARHAAWQVARCSASPHPSCSSITRAIAAHCDRTATLR